MFEKTRKKIVAAIMSVLIMLFFGTLAVIYGFSYREVSESNQEMMERYAELFSLEEQPGEWEARVLSENGKTENLEDEQGHESEMFEYPEDELRAENMLPEMRGELPVDEVNQGKEPMLELSVFYSVAVSDNGEILAIDNDNKTLYEYEDLEEFAVSIVKDGKQKGTKETLLYISTKRDNYTLVTFMDNTILQQSITTLFRYTLVFGSAMLIVMFFVAVYLAKRIVRPLEESYEKQKQFISDAGHELQTPVSVVSANAELLSRELGSNQWLTNIQYENERMGKLVGQLLELARTENVTPQKERLDFSHLVVGEALPFESVAFEKGLMLNCDIEKNLFVEGNSVQLKQLVSILLDNAVQHSSSDGREIVLSLSAERGHVRLSVVNSGVEIPPEQWKKLFERFYRVDTARNGEDKHYGLGLAIAKSIVTAHKGKIDVRCYDGKVEFSVIFCLAS